MRRTQQSTHLLLLCLAVLVSFPRALVATPRWEDPCNVLDVALESLLESLNSTLGCPLSSPQVIPTTWDLLLVAAAFAQVSPSAAAARLSAIFSAQQSDGLVPSLNYELERGSGNCTQFPPSNLWTITGDAVSSNRLASPPIHATVALAIFYQWMTGPQEWQASPSVAGVGFSRKGLKPSESALLGRRRNQDSTAQPDALKWAAELWNPLFSWYSWVFSHRCLTAVGAPSCGGGAGLYWIASPWESAVPSNVAWGHMLEESLPGYRLSSNASLVWARMQAQLAALPPNLATSTAYPGNAQYNQSWLATACVVGCAYDSVCILDECPFVAASATDNALLARAIVDLQTLMQWLQLKGPAPSGSANPTVTDAQAAAVKTWASPGASTADAVLQVLYVPPSEERLFAWVADAALAPGASCSSPPCHRSLRIASNLPSSGSSVAAIGMPDSTARGGSWRAALLLSLADDAAWSPPRMVSLARTDPAFEASGPGYAGAVWADVAWLLWAGLTSSSASTTALPAEQPLAAAVAEGLALCNCAAWGSSGRGAARGPLYGAFDAGAACAPLLNSTAAFVGGGTGPALAAVTLLMLRPPVVPVPLPASGSVPGRMGIAFAMCAELILVAGIALGCVVLGGQQVRRLAVSSAAPGGRAVKSGSASKGFPEGESGGALRRSLNAVVTSDTPSPSPPPSRGGAPLFWTDEQETLLAPSPSPVVGFYSPDALDEAAVGDVEDEEANWWMQWYGDDEEGSGTVGGGWVDADALGPGESCSSGGCCRRRVIASVAQSAREGGQRESAMIGTRWAPVRVGSLPPGGTNSRDGLRRPLLQSSDDGEAVPSRPTALTAAESVSHAMTRGAPSAVRNASEPPVRSALRNSSRTFLQPAGVIKGLGVASSASQSGTGTLPAVPRPGAADSAGDVKAPLAPPPLDLRRRSVRFLLEGAPADDSGGAASQGSEHLVLVPMDAAGFASATPTDIVAQEVRVYNADSSSSLSAVGGPLTPRPTNTRNSLASAASAADSAVSPPSTPTGGPGGDATAAVLQSLQSPVSDAGLDIGAAGAGLVRSVLSLPGALWSIVAPGGSGSPLETTVGLGGLGADSESSSS